MLDEELVIRAVEALRIAAALILQDAADVAVARLPKGQEERLQMTTAIEAAGRDVGVLSAACRVLISRLEGTGLAD